MKKSLLFSTLILFLSINICAQVPNGDFENWSGDAPVGWASVNLGVQTIFQSSDAQSGGSAVKLAVGSLAGIDVGPVLYTGTLTDPGFAVTQKYASLSGYYKFTKAVDDILSIAVTMTKNNNVIGEGLLDISSGASSYTSFKIELTYIGNDIPDKCNIYIVISSADTNSAAHSGSSALIDNLSMSTATSVDNESIPDNYSLSQNYPNPFNPSTTIKYQIANTGNVTLKVYDILGNEIKTLVDGQKAPGKYEVNFDGSKLSSGLYFYQLKTPGFVQTKKMMMLK